MFGTQKKPTTVSLNTSELEEVPLINPETGFPWTERERRYIQRQQTTDTMTDHGAYPAAVQAALTKKWTEIKKKEKDYQLNKAALVKLIEALTNDEAEFKADQQALRSR